MVVEGVGKEVPSLRAVTGSGTIAPVAVNTSPDNAISYFAFRSG